MRLVIAEKPSVAKSLAAVLGAATRKDGYLEGGGWLVSWCLGHLAEYLPPDGYDKRYESWKYEDLPIIPDEWKLAVSQEKKEQFYTLKRLLNSPDVEYVVNACDAGREGELIFRRVYQLSGSRKPVKRLWISSVTDKAIREGFARLKPGKDYENLYHAAVARAESDWVVGINATRALTCRYNAQLSCGRVQTYALPISWQCHRYRCSWHSI